MLWEDRERLLRMSGTPEDVIIHQKQAFYAAAFSMVYELVHYENDLVGLQCAIKNWREEVQEDHGQRLEMSETIPGHDRVQDN